MDQATVDAIKTLGFPIVGCIFLGAFLWKIGMWAMGKGDRLVEKIETHVDIANAEIQKINPKLEAITEHMKKQVCQAPDFQGGGKRSIHA